MKLNGGHDYGNNGRKSPLVICLAIKVETAPVARFSSLINA